MSNISSVGIVAVSLVKSKMKGLSVLRLVLRGDILIAIWFGNRDVKKREGLKKERKREREAGYNGI